MSVIDVRLICTQMRVTDRTVRDPTRKAQQPRTTQRHLQPWRQIIGKLLHFPSKAQTLAGIIITAAYLPRDLATAMVGS